MFTGLVQKVGKFAGLSQRDGGTVINIECTPWENDPLVLGESVAVQGACLTVVAVSANGFAADVLQETLDCTVLGALKSGDALNLERALRLCDRMGGHIVAGHVDCVGTVSGISRASRDWVLRVACPRDDMKYVVQKGSVALNGVSLTVSALVSDTEFEVNIIPTTWRETSLADAKIGGGINVETDIIGRHIERLASFATHPRADGVTLEQLANAGFLN